MTLVGWRRCRIVVAVAVGLVIQAADRMLLAVALDRSITIAEPFVFISNALLTALPLIALALQRRQHVFPWLIGFGVSSWLAWWWLQKGIAYQRDPDGSGVDLGGAVLMLFAPLVITGVCLWLNQWLVRRSAHHDNLP